MDNKTWTMANPHQYIIDTITNSEEANHLIVLLTLYRRAITNESNGQSAKNITNQIAEATGDPNILRLVGIENRVVTSHATGNGSIEA